MYMVRRYGRLVVCAVTFRGNACVRPRTPLIMRSSPPAPGVASMAGPPLGGPSSTWACATGICTALLLPRAIRSGGMPIGAGATTPGCSGTSNNPMLKDSRRSCSKLGWRARGALHLLGSCMRHSMSVEPRAIGRAPYFGQKMVQKPWRA